MTGAAMEFENHKEEVPFAHYAQLFPGMNPAEAVSRLTGIGWDGEAFSLKLMHREYRITHPACHIQPVDGGELPPRIVQTFLLRYLLECRNIPWFGGWKTFREMPWGEMYVKPFTGRALTRAAFTFAHKLDAFRTACEKMGAEKVNRGDAGYQFDFIGSYKMQILVWEGDDEFPPNAQILYSDNFAEGFTAEDRVVAADILITAIKNNM